MIVADSSVWIDNIRQRDTPQVRLLRASEQNDVIAGDIVVLEVLRGVRSEREAASAGSPISRLWHHADA